MPGTNNENTLGYLWSYEYIVLNFLALMLFHASLRGILTPFNGCLDFFYLKYCKLNLTACNLP